MKRQGQGRLRHRLLKTALGALCISFLLIFPTGLIAEYYARLMGHPASVSVLVLLGALWLLFCLGGFRFLFSVFHHLGHNYGHQHAPNMWDNVMDALDRLSVGDFNIHVEKQDHFYYSELADKVNRLARDLSSMEAMRQEFISNVSHEMQSPLTSISGFASLLKKENLSPEKRLHYLQVIENEAKRLSRLSDNLLRLSTLESDQVVFSPLSFRLDKQIEETLLMLEPQWAEKALEMDIDLDPVTIQGGEDLLSQVWINLLHNAIKFTPHNGSVLVSLRRQEEQAVCTISDSGVGIPDSSLPHIFERFYKADSARDRSMGGNGLGLSLVRKIIDLHGGGIDVHSAPGKGTSFVISLPIDAARNHQECPCTTIEP